VLVADKEFAAEREVVAAEDPLACTEPEGEALIDAVPDPDGERDARREGRAESLDRIQKTAGRLLDHVLGDEGEKNESAPALAV
jgi:hypothetical protein